MYLYACCQLATVHITYS